MKAAPAHDARIIDGRSHGAFRVAVLVTLALMGFFGLVIWQPDFFAGLLGRDSAGHLSHHFREHHHRVHDLTYAFLLGTAFLGLVAQLRAPSRNVAGQLMALIPFAGLTLSSVMTGTAVLSIPWVVVGASTLFATILHPTGRDLFRSLSPSRADRVMLALVIVAAIPLLAFASNNIGLQRTIADDHAALGHYGFMAAFSFTVIGVGLLASLRPDGWRLAAWVAGFLPALLGLASIAFPDVVSSLSLVGALAALAWGITFVAAAEFIHPRGTGDMGNTGMRPYRGSTTSTPSWVYVLGLIVIVLGVLFAILHLTGGGPTHLP